MIARKGFMPLFAATAVGVLAPWSSAQLVREAESFGPRVAQERGWSEPVGPADQLGVPALPPRARPDPSGSALLQENAAPPGGFTNLSPAIRWPDASGAVAPGGGTRYINQPINCDGNGWFSNNNSNNNPYLVFDDFVASSAPLRNVEFYGGVYGGSYSLGAISSIGIEIWTIGSGGLCGWVYDGLVARDTFTLAELYPAFECDVSNGLFDAYKFSAWFDSPIPLTSGRNYMITIYATLVNPDGGELFVWCDTLSPHYNQATSWNRSSQEYVRCSPDMAFRTNAQVPTCQYNDCQTTCYFSNYYSNVNPYIVLDDFTAAFSGDLRRIQITGGVWDGGSGTGTDFRNIAGLYIEVYGAIASDNYPCGNFVSGFLGAHQVPLGETFPRYDCTDIFGISHYTFTIEMPAGFTLSAGGRYMLGAYGIPVNPDSDDLFCWGGTDAVYGFTSWSYDLVDNAQEVCHEVDQAWCINPARPCFADFNGDGVVDTRDVLAFLNAWSAGRLTADMDYNLIIDTRDVLAFLNIWTHGC